MLCKRLVENVDESLTPLIATSARQPLLPFVNEAINDLGNLWGNLWGNFGKILNTK